MVTLIDDKATRTVALNIRYLCWKKCKDRNQWPALLTSWLGQKNATSKAEAMLSEMSGIALEDIGLLVTELNLDEGEFVYGAMHVTDGVDVLHENLLRLLSKSGGQTKRALAGQFGVSPSTLSRWINGIQAPDTSARRGIALLFGLHDSIELEERPMFLSYLPISYGEQVAWINSRLHDMSSHSLRELFPALQLIFSQAKSGVGSLPSKQQNLVRLRQTTVKK